MPARKKLLTIPQAWRRIARDLAKKNISHFGLCNKVRELYDQDRITYEATTHMNDAIADNVLLDGRPADAFWMSPVWCSTPLDAPERSARILAALFLALEAEDAGNL